MARARARARARADQLSALAWQSMGQQPAVVDAPSKYQVRYPSVLH